MAQRNLDKQFRTNIARNFVEQVQSTDCLFACLGSAKAPSLFQRTERQENVFRNKLLTATRIVPNDICLVIDRVDWTSGTVYDKLNDDVDMSNRTFYVLNSDNNVYVCIDNNGGLPSTQEPTGTDTNEFTLGDNYIWKFLYAIPSNKIKFLDSDTIPIVELKTYENESAPYTDARQLQYSVQKNALADGRSGTILNIDLSTTNTGVYSGALPGDLNQFVVGASADSVIITDALNQTGTYNDYSIRIVTGRGSGQLKTISNNTVLATGKNQVNLESGASFSPIPEVGDRYEIIPRITISGNGTGAEAYPIIDRATLRISDVVVKEPGTNYTTATAAINTTASSGTPPTLTPVIFSPVGENAVFELFTTKVKLFATMVPDNTNNKDRILSNDYSNIAVWFNPLNSAGYNNPDKIASFADVRKTNLNITKKDVDIAVGSINAGDYLFGETSNILGKIFASTRESNTSATVTIENLKTDFTYDETLALLQTSGGTLTDSGLRFTAKTTFSDDTTLSPPQNTYRLATRVDIETVSGAAVTEDRTVTGASGGVGTVVQFLNDVNSSPPTGSMLLSDVSPSADGASFGFDVGERITLPDSTGATVNAVFAPELNLFSGRMLYIEGGDPIIRTFEQTDVLQLTFEF